MATFTMTPDGTTSNDWTVVGSSAHEAVQSDDGDTTYIHSNTDTDSCILTMGAPSVAESAIDFAGDGVAYYRLFALGRCPDRGTAGTDVSLTVTDPSNGSLVVTANFHNHRTDNESESGPTQNTSGITYSDLEGMTVRLLKSGTDRAIITYVYVVVNYTATATVADNATFFGTNF